jgi:Domain of unknown function (DUF5122) beta-propeller
MGKIFTRKQFSDYLGENRAILDIVTTYISGTTDSFLNIGSGFDGLIRSVYIDDNDDIFCGGQQFSYNGEYQRLITKLRPDGSLDPIFQSPFSGYTVITSVSDIVPDGLGNIYICGSFGSAPLMTKPGLTKLNMTTGVAQSNWSSSTDPSFNSSVDCITVLSDGSIMLGGFFTTYDGNPAPRIWRLNPDNTSHPDNNWGSGFTGGYVARILQIDDNTILVAHGSNQYRSTPTRGLIKLDLDTGDISAGWSMNTSVGVVTNLEIDSDGNILIVGSFTQWLGQQRRYVAKLDINGNLLSYDVGTPWLAVADQVSYCILDETNDALYLVGSIQGSKIYGYTKLKYSTGEVDQTFSLLNKVDLELTVTQKTLALDSDKNIYYGGAYTSLGIKPLNRISKLKPDGTSLTRT